MYCSQDFNRRCCINSKCYQFQEESPVYKTYQSYQYVGIVYLTVVLVTNRFQNILLEMHICNHNTCSNSQKIGFVKNSLNHYLTVVDISLALELFYTNAHVTTSKYVQIMTGRTESRVTSCIQQPHLPLVGMVYNSKCEIQSSKMLKTGSCSQNTNIAINHLDYHMKACIQQINN